MKNKGRKENRMKKLGKEWENDEEEKTTFLMNIQLDDGFYFKFFGVKISLFFISI